MGLQAALQGAEAAKQRVSLTTQCTCSAAANYYSQVQSCTEACKIMSVAGHNFAMLLLQDTD